jgi:hypothetical protein
VIDLPNWNFKERIAGSKNRNPIQDEFFNSSEALTEISSLVRESIQNSLDAKIENSNDPVLLKFSISEISKKIATEYFQDLSDHLLSSIPGPKSFLESEKCRTLVVEDFNTSGLLGNSLKDSLNSEDDPAKNGFYYFVWAEGSSAKTDGNRGRWGIGKIVFPRLSSIKTFFVLSNRSKEFAPCKNEQLLLGMSILKGHSLEGKTYQPDGWWSDFTPDGIPIPVSKDVHPKFKKDWNLRREEETGLSIVIPYIPDFITKELIRDCVIRDYFIAIQQGLLVVEISDEESEYKLDKLNLRAECLNIGVDDRIANSKTRDEMVNLIDMVSDSQQQNAKIFSIDVNDDFENRWNSIFIDPAVANAALNELDSGNTVNFKVAVKIPSKDSSSFDYFTIHLRRMTDVRTSAVFCREGIVIPSASPNLIRDHLILVIASKGILANLLADAEGPAHEKWSDKTDKFRQNYPGYKGGQILTFLRKAPTEMIFKIRGNASQKDSTAFANFFPLPGDPKMGSSSGVKPTKKGEGLRPSEPSKPEIPRSEQKFQIDSSTNGFSIKSINDDTTLIGKEIEALVAYKVRSGDSFSKWQIEDFDLTKINPKLEGCTITKTKGNSATIYITGRKFKAIWNGFDQIRDLDIKANLKNFKE